MNHIQKFIIVCGSLRCTIKNDFLKKKGQPKNVQSKELLKKNLMLILDWNHPEIALAEIFQREGSYKLDVDKSMFEKALLKKNREEAAAIYLFLSFIFHSLINLF
jgi:hypothetical protein